MKVLVLIPARGGSKGLPGKNIRPLNGIPLINYSIQTAKEAGIMDIVVSTDDIKIAEIAKEAGAQVPFLRPDELSSDTARSIDVAIHALNYMESVNKTIYEALLLLQPTSPFRLKEDLLQCIEILKNNPNADSVISVVDVEGHHPARMKFIENGYLIDPSFGEEMEGQNRQELTPMYIRNGSIYLSRRESILGGSYKGKNCMAYVMPSKRSVNIDTLEDFQFAEWIDTKR